MKKHLRYIILCALTAAALMALSAVSPSFRYLSASVAAGVRSLPVYSVERPDNKLSISFDASWGAEHTQKLLDILDEYGVKATFFLVNIWLEDYPELALEIAARGHEIGLHSVSHPRFTTLSARQMREELQGNYELIRQITGCEARLFRPPFGDYNNAVIDTAMAQGFTPVQWSIDSLDWKDLSAEEISARVLKNIGSGDIVLFHNNGLHTAEALPGILQSLRDRGLELCPISELLLTGESYIDGSGRQRPKP